MRSAPGVTHKVFSILGAFDAANRELSLTALAERAQLALSTTHRLVGELVAEGAMARTAGGRYVIGRRLWDLGLMAPIEPRLRRIAEPFLQDVHVATKATVHLAVLDGEQVLYLDRVMSRSTRRVRSSVGSTLPLHATGVGKVLLAHAPEDVQRAAVGSLTRLTPHTIIQPGVLTAQLARVRKQGFATTDEELESGSSSVAVPVRRGESGEVVAAIGAVIPPGRRDRPRLLTALRVAARGIGRSLY